MDITNLSNVAEIAGASDSPTPAQWDAWQAHLDRQRAKWPGLY